MRLKDGEIAAFRALFGPKIGGQIAAMAKKPAGAKG
jgi:hypothetical protein